MYIWWHIWKRLFQFWGALPLLLAITVTVHRIHSTLYLVEHNCLVWISSLLCFLIYGMHHFDLLQSQVVVNFTEPLGLAAGFVHKVNVRSDVLPVQYQKLCRQPFAVRDAVSQALKRLESEGIIEKGDSSPWVSPLVVIQKKYGGIWLCVDLRESNKAVIIDSHPLPHIEDVLQNCMGLLCFRQ